MSFMLLMFVAKIKLIFLHKYSTLCHQLYEVTDVNLQLINSQWLKINCAWIVRHYNNIYNTPRNDKLGQPVPVPVCVCDEAFFCHSSWSVKLSRKQFLWNLGCQHEKKVVRTQGFVAKQSLANMIRVHYGIWWHLQERRDANWMEKYNFQEMGERHKSWGGGCPSCLPENPKPEVTSIGK